MKFSLICWGWEGGLINENKDTGFFQVTENYKIKHKILANINRP